MRLPWCVYDEGENELFAEDFEYSRVICSRAAERILDGRVLEVNRFFKARLVIDFDDEWEVGP